MSQYVVDANVILRFLTGEPKSEAKRAAEFFQQCEENGESLVLTRMVVAEVVFVLTGDEYGCDRAQVAEELTNFLKNPYFSFRDFEVLSKALDIFKEYEVDFADAYLAAVAMLNDTPVLSFDSEFEKIPGLKTFVLKPKD